ncbi:hypothetical protein RAE21_06360 [Rhodoferax sp. TBRC 17198]|uniref:hypothetical protein n=1 Tax=Rhodoferax potami TaxID=3068338 RepID=UPI0028BF180F|nr:hypothetical protein [Rhodoferax sp. TBRC 17198]MDT7522034.1 hypothetical protein [Rhodoferax sp. TBRC 17198]
MDLLREKLKARAGLSARLMGGGGGGGSSSENKTETTNIDSRMAVQDGAGLSNSSGNTVNVNSTDAVQTVANMGADTLKNIGGAIVELNKTTTATQATSWDNTVNAGAKLIDKLIDKSTTTAEAAINSFQPAENKANDTSLKLGMIAAAGVAAVVILGRMK